MIRPLWELVAILRNRYVRVQLVKSADPGIVVYSDEHQVAAIPHRVRRDR